MEQGHSEGPVPQTSMPLPPKVTVNGDEHVQKMKKSLKKAKQMSRRVHAETAPRPLPGGWTRKIVQRQTGRSAGKYDVYLFSPTKKKFRSRVELQRHFDEIKSDLSADMFDFRVAGMEKIAVKAHPPRVPPLMTGQPDEETEGGGALCRLFAAAIRQQEERAKKKLIRKKPAASSSVVVSSTGGISSRTSKPFGKLVVKLPFSSRSSSAHNVNSNDTVGKALPSPPRQISFEDALLSAASSSEKDDGVGGGRSSSYGDGGGSSQPPLPHGLSNRGVYTNTSRYFNAMCVSGGAVHRQQPKRTLYRPYVDNDPDSNDVHHDSRSSLSSSAAAAADWSSASKRLDEAADIWLAYSSALPNAAVPITPGLCKRSPSSGCLPPFCDSPFSTAKCGDGWTSRSFQTSSNNTVLSRGFALKTPTTPSLMTTTVEPPGTEEPHLSPTTTTPQGIPDDHNNTNDKTFSSLKGVHRGSIIIANSPSSVLSKDSAVSKEAKDDVIIGDNVLNAQEEEEEKEEDRVTGFKVHLMNSENSPKVAINDVLLTRSFVLETEEKDGGGDDDAAFSSFSLKVVDDQLLSDESSVPVKDADSPHMVSDIVFTKQASVLQEEEEDVANKSPVIGSDRVEIPSDVLVTTQEANSNLPSVDNSDTCITSDATSGSGCDIDCSSNSDKADVVNHRHRSKKPKVDSSTQTDSDATIYVKRKRKRMDKEVSSQVPVCHGGGNTSEEGIQTDLLNCPLKDAGSPMTTTTTTSGDGPIENALEVTKSTAVAEMQPRLSSTSKWVPPKSPFNLIQEYLYGDPWALLVATIFLQRSQGNLAVPLLWRFLETWPTAVAASTANWKDIAKLMEPLGISEKRGKMIIQFSKEYLTKPWTNPSELYGIGKYGSDSYRIFCVNQWKEVEPDDYMLRRYLGWLCLNKESLGIN